MLFYVFIIEKNVDTNVTQSSIFDDIVRRLLCLLIRYANYKVARKISHNIFVCLKFIK